MEIRAWKCEVTGKLFEHKQTYTKHVNKMLAKKEREIKFSELKLNRERVLREAREKCETVEDLVNYVNDYRDYICMTVDKNHVPILELRPVQNFNLNSPYYTDSFFWRDNECIGNPELIREKFYECYNLEFKFKEVNRNKCFNRIYSRAAGFRLTTSSFCAEDGLFFYRASFLLSAFPKMQENYQAYKSMLIMQS